MNNHVFVSQCVDKHMRYAVEELVSTRLILSVCLKVVKASSNRSLSPRADSTSVKTQFLPNMWKAGRSRQRLMEIKFHSSQLSSQTQYIHAGRTNLQWKKKLCLFYLFNSMAFDVMLEIPLQCKTYQEERWRLFVKTNYSV